MKSFDTPRPAGWREAEQVQRLFHAVNPPTRRQVARALDRLARAYDLQVQTRKHHCSSFPVGECSGDNNPTGEDTTHKEAVR